MKLISHLLISVLLVLNIACSGVKTYDDPNYTPPTISYQPRIIYPTIAEENNWTGKSTILLKISERGNVISTTLLTSSRYDLLDKTADDFCKNLNFNPALYNNNPISTYFKMEIEFNFSTTGYNVEEYIKEVLSLYKKNELKTDADMSILQSEILELHNSFIVHTRETHYINQYINLVIQPKIVLEWQNSWDVWPLLFLLYHDFLDRYPNYANADEVEMKMYLILKEDINYIKNSSNIDLNKERLIDEILSFFAKEYPKIDIDSLNCRINGRAKLII